MHIIHSYTISSVASTLAYRYAVLRCAVQSILPSARVESFLVYGALFSEEILLDNAQSLYGPVGKFAIVFFLIIYFNHTLNKFEQINTNK